MDAFNCLLMSVGPHQNSQEPSLQFPQTSSFDICLQLYFSVNKTHPQWKCHVYFIVYILGAGFSNEETMPNYPLDPYPIEYFLIEKFTFTLQKVLVQACLKRCFVHRTETIVTRQHFSKIVLYLNVPKANGPSGRGLNQHQLLNCVH